MRHPVCTYISNLPIFQLAQNREQMFGINVYAQSLEEKYDLHNPLLEFAKDIHIWLISNKSRVLVSMKDLCIHIFDLNCATAILRVSRCCK